jgi:transcription antitermination factor NusG
MQSAAQERPNSHDSLTGEWFAAYVKHHHERKAAQLLKQKGIEVFLPQIKEVHRWKDRNKALFLPLFPGYLFLFSDLRDKFQILNTPGVFFLVESAGIACPVPRHEIDAIRRLIGSGVQVKPHPFVSAGDRVRIRSGPLSGVQGMLTHFKNQYRVVLSVGLLQKAVSIEVEAANVERIVEPRSNHHGSQAADLGRNKQRIQVAS